MSDDQTIDELCSMKRGFLDDLKQGDSKYEKTMIICERINTRIQRKTFKQITSIKEMLFDIQESLKQSKIS